jgi:biopolymer transport protein ExbD
VLQNALGPRAVKLVFVGAGDDRTYQEVVTAIDRARGAGAEVVAFLPPESPLH